MNYPAVETQHLTKHFKDFWQRISVTAVRDVSIRVPAGSIFGLLGPNGSGKTTTLKLLTGLLNPSEGCVTILGGSPRQKATRRRLGYLPETDGLYGYLSARENLLFYAGLFGLSRKDARRRANELLETTGLTKAAERPVGEFSKGMKRRIGLAQALLNQPDLLILDEPTAGLDPAGCRHIKALLRTMAAAGKTVIVSSHLLADIEDICDAVCILHSGRVIASGPLCEMLEKRDLTRFTAGPVTAAQRQALQDSFRLITGSEAGIDHPRLALETFFADAVRAAESGVDGKEENLPAPPSPPRSVL